MSYKVKIRSSVRRRIVAWNLPDTVFVEVLIRLEQQLGQNPAAHLVRARHPFEGMNYGFSLVDPTNRLREFAFFFHITYGQDEQTLEVINCAYHVTGL
ncbi:MAG TPA: hypothetical protein VNK04_19185 [Gemmataceae bacterium]|jgi:hypothetical protein|nr:hypothetical protein [Gemmataceae bacterium]